MSVAGARCGARRARCCSRVQFTAAASGTRQRHRGAGPVRGRRRRCTCAAVHPGDAGAGQRRSRAQVRAGSRWPSAARATSAVSSGASAIVTSTLATVVSVMRHHEGGEHHAPAQARTATARARRGARGATGRPARAATTAAATSASALKALRQKVTSKLRAASSWRVDDAGDAPQQRGNHHHDNGTTMRHARLESEAHAVSRATF